MSDIWNDLTDSFNREMAIDEMKKKYDGTVLILVKPEGGEHVVTYHGYTDKYHWFKDENGVDIRLLHDTNYKIICKFPERVMFNSNKLALEFVRLPSRQFRRGIYRDNMKIYSPVAQNWTGDSYNWDLGVIRDALYPKYPRNLESAMKSLYNKEVASIALNSKFAVSQSLTKKEDCYYVFYSRVLIGYIQGTTFFVKHSLFKQEVMDNLSVFHPFKVEF